MSLKFIDLFCGAGGLSHGLEMAGHKCLLGNDCNSFFLKTFIENHPRAVPFSGPIQFLTEEKLSSLLHTHVDLVVGGPPCQGFSTVGTNSINDKRNNLFLEYCRIVELLQPKFIVFENVTGITSKKYEPILEQLMNKLTVLGYHFDLNILESQHYGVPQRRKRTILIGATFDFPVIFPEKKYDINLNGAYVPPVTVGEVLSNLKSSSGEIYNHNIKQAIPANKQHLERIKYIPEGKGIRYQEDEKKYLPEKLWLGKDWKNLKEGRLRQTQYQRLDRNKTSPTIMTLQHNYYHPTQNRYLTQREAAAIQSFPNDFKFIGKNDRIWKQIGNAVPPMLGKAIGVALLEMANNKCVNKMLVGPQKMKDLRSTAFQY
ncbi:MAG: DNA cytosine methyltransferase [Bacteriovoracaceae bacterium]|nr:DNA cytosine methyltransferase [Bacteriovoracaceae bacterium]